MSGVTESGVYNVTDPVSSDMIDVYCDMVTDNGGWLVSLGFRCHLSLVSQFDVHNIKTGIKVKLYNCLIYVILPEKVFPVLGCRVSTY